MTGSFPVDLPHSSAYFPNLLHSQNGRGGQISEGWIMTPVETMEPLSGRMSIMARCWTASPR